jgi:ABC-2 type transport system ATP-binding protein
MISVSGLSKSFGATVAVDHVDMEVKPGEIVGLVGVNGAGKTTLLRMLSGILQPDEGSIDIAGSPMNSDGIEARGKLAFVPDTPMLFEQLTVHEHMLFIARLYGVSGVEARVDSLLEEFALADRRHATTNSLSRGMRQKVAICCAFLHDPEVLLLDEPLTGLDPLGRKRMCDAVAARAERGSAVLISSHQLEIIERLCSRFMIIHQGRTRLEGSLAEIRTGLGSFEDVFLSVTGTEDDREAEPA